MFGQWGLSAEREDEDPLLPWGCQLVGRALFADRGRILAFVKGMLGHALVRLVARPENSVLSSSDPPRKMSPARMHN